MVYEEAISVQPLVEPANVDGKARKSEIIGELKEMVKVNSLNFLAFLCLTPSILLQ